MQGCGAGTSSALSPHGAHKDFCGTDLVVVIKKKEFKQKDDPNAKMVTIDQSSIQKETLNAQFMVNRQNQ